jgi:putative SOS response-associated peptidase YedK
MNGCGVDKTKRPYCFDVGEEDLFAFAGVWDRWRIARSNRVKAGWIMTRTPNAVTAPVHDRMPVILDLDGYASWFVTLCQNQIPPSGYRPSRKLMGY